MSKETYPFAKRMEARRLHPRFAAPSSITAAERHLVTLGLEHEDARRLVRKTWGAGKGEEALAHALAATAELEAGVSKEDVGLVLMEAVREFRALEAGAPSRSALARQRRHGVTAAAWEEGQTVSTLPLWSAPEVPGSPAWPPGSTVVEPISPTSLGYRQELTDEERETYRDALLSDRDTGRFQRVVHTVTLEEWRARQEAPPPAPRDRRSDAWEPLDVVPLSDDGGTLDAVDVLNKEADEARAAARAHAASEVEQQLSSLLEEAHQLDLRSFEARLLARLEDLGGERPQGWDLLSEAEAWSLLDWLVEAWGPSWDDHVEPWVPLQLQHALTRGERSESDERARRRARQLVRNL